MSDSQLPRTIEELIVQAQIDCESGDHLSAIAHALTAIAEQGQPVDTVEVAEDDELAGRMRMWTANFLSTTDPQEAQHVTVDTPAGGPAGRQLFVRWADAQRRPPRTVAVVFNTTTGRPVAVYANPQMAHWATEGQHNLGFSEWRVL